MRLSEGSAGLRVGTSKTEPAAARSSRIKSGPTDDLSEFFEFTLASDGRRTITPLKTTEHQEYKQSNHSTCPFEAWKIKEKRTVIRK
ncbi:hypothetical protein PGTUg99_001840 [Puccinia graminis f. sp. tritici]|uniref:Uncharacterized protein n=1 Tax=Puccinia graminis f. sp. tritici TaxID=56615 RepID=A0A5B0QY71_PUCGR|nr:hypothetical protein PGTUg99_001840 [Puccinia graminis f. sp. tritici]